MAQTENNMTIEVIKIGISCLTPIVVVILGFIISKKVERSRMAFLKEKEWQVRWADLFLNQAIEYNKNISIIVCSLHGLVYENKENESNIEKLLNQIEISKKIITDIDWDIQNFAQFAELNKDIVIVKQRLLRTKLDESFRSKIVDLEAIRQLQFDYNHAVRKAHHEILNMDVKTGMSITGNHKTLGFKWIIKFYSHK